VGEVKSKVINNDLIQLENDWMYAMTKRDRKAGRINGPGIHSDRL